MKGLKTIIGIGLPMAAMLSMPTSIDRERIAYSQITKPGQISLEQARAEFNTTVLPRVKKYFGRIDLEEFYLLDFTSKDYADFPGEKNESKETFGLEAKLEAEQMRKKFEETQSTIYGRKVIAASLAYLQYSPNGSYVAESMQTIKWAMNDIDRIENMIAQKK